MPVRPEGTPCWADAMFTDLEGARDFYGSVLGWTFGEASTQFGGYTQAYADGKAVAAIVPPMPGQEQPSAWCLYLASDDVEETARRVREHGGQLLLEPMRVGDFGAMALVREPSGTVFGLWQSGTHEGFDVMGVPGAYAWAEVYTREPEKADTFFQSVFSYRGKELVGGEQPPDMDFRLYDLGEETVLGRMRMGADFPPEVPAYINVYFMVDDCDAAVARATERGGVLRFGPVDTPYGRLAALSDPQGASFSVVDGNTTGEEPGTADVA
ncbi:VOC family protein [Streptomyces sp. NPDC047928]|uniref:VOC family protein n=1 Tax=unclassified Streptomyces TaxID=2593676 RepID=UPI0037222881